MEPRNDPLDEIDGIDLAFGIDTGFLQVVEKTSFDCPSPPAAGPSKALRLRRHRSNSAGSESRAFRSCCARRSRSALADARARPLPHPRSGRAPATQGGPHEVSPSP